MCARGKVLGRFLPIAYVRCEVRRVCNATMVTDGIVREEKATCKRGYGYSVKSVLF